MRNPLMLVVGMLGALLALAIVVFVLANRTEMAVSLFPYPRIVMAPVFLVVLVSFAAGGPLRRPLRLDARPSIPPVVRRAQAEREATRNKPRLGDPRARRAEVGTRPATARVTAGTGLNGRPAMVRFITAREVHELADYASARRGIQALSPGGCRRGTRHSPVPAGAVGDRQRVSGPSRLAARRSGGNQARHGVSRQRVHRHGASLGAGSLCALRRQGWQAARPHRRHRADTAQDGPRIRPRAPAFSPARMPAPCSWWAPAPWRRTSSWP